MVQLEDMDRNYLRNEFHGVIRGIISMSRGVQLNLPRTDEPRETPEGMTKLRLMLT